MMMNRSLLTILFQSLLFIALTGLSTGCQRMGTDNGNPGIADEGSVDETLPHNKSQLLASADTNTKELYPEQNKGDSDRIDVWSYPEETKIGFIRFDLSHIPSSSRIASAKLRLYVVKVRDFDEGLVEFYQIEGDWDEYQITYSNQSLLGFKLIGSRMIYKSEQESYIEIDITELAQKWVRGDFANDGIAISAPGINKNVRIEFGSKENVETPGLLELQWQ